MQQVNKIWKVKEECRKKLARAEGVLAESGRGNTYRTGFLGVVSAKLDPIDHCNKKIKELLPKFEAEQQITLREKQEAAALVFFNSRVAAVFASQTIHAQKTGTWTVTEAAEPRQLLRANLPKNCSQIQTR
ncbi:CSC1-like protein ERD4 [Musa acuminata AAA Group]|uniref:CSC1-like protein ERD4 n=1 Tax=Musa acuminata AAA Group TaxID=214697 RepID=UPI0031D05ED5